MDNPRDRMVDYFLRRKKQLSDYSGEQTRLKNILNIDASEGIKTSLGNVHIEEHKQLESKEEFFDRIKGG